MFTQILVYSGLVVGMVALLIATHGNSRKLDRTARAIHE